MKSDFIIDDNGILTEYLGCDSEIVIPDGINGIADRVFCDRKEITSVIIPNSVKSIGSYAFSSCINLKNVVLPKK